MVFKISLDTQPNLIQGDLRRLSLQGFSVKLPELPSLFLQGTYCGTAQGRPAHLHPQTFDFYPKTSLLHSLASSQTVPGPLSGSHHALICPLSALLFQQITSVKSLIACRPFPTSQAPGSRPDHTVSYSPLHSHAELSHPVCVLTELLID